MFPSTCLVNFWSCHSPSFQEDLSSNPNLHKWLVDWKKSLLFFILFFLKFINFFFRILKEIFFLNLLLFSLQKKNSTLFSYFFSLLFFSLKIFLFLHFLVNFFFLYFFSLHFFTIALNFFNDSLVQKIYIYNFKIYTCYIKKWCK